MALSDGPASQKQVLEAQRRARAYREARERAAALEIARTSDVRTFDDESGNTWTYVVLDEREVRIEKCASDEAKLDIPAVIEGKPVVALAADACAYLPLVEEITCPDSIVSIGFCAFRCDTKLRSIVFPAHVPDFDSDWLRSCQKLDYLVLPGQLEQLDASIFDVQALKTLVIGAGTASIYPGAFAKSQLVDIRIDEGNPYLMTDGRAIYSRDGSVLIAAVLPMAECTVLDGCRGIAKKGFSNFECIERIVLPDSLEVLGEFALSRTGITSFTAPPSLKRIMEKAFFNCADLKEVHLNEGLVAVDDNAFTATGIHELRLPASIERLGDSIAARTDLTYAGPDATFSIAKGSTHLQLDESGGLYREQDDGLHLIRMMDPDASFYEVRSGTVAVDEGAFANHAHVAEIKLPEGLRVIEKAAFKACRNLERVNIPDSVRRIEAEAFLDTSITSVRLPASLEHLGLNALITYGAHHGETRPSLHEVVVDDANGLFYTTPGLLLERKGDGNSRVLLCTGDVDVIRIPPEVDEIAPYAFNDIGNIRELHLCDRIASIGVRGLAVDCLLDRIHVDFVKPISGHDFIDLSFPDTDRGAQQMMLALSVPDHVDPAIMYESYDNTIINGSSFDPSSGEGLEVYDQATRIARRLLDPIFLTPVNRSMCDRTLRTNIEDICVEIARHDDRESIDLLLDLGYLNADNLYSVIDRVAALQDAAMTDYLLEAKRVRFKQDAMDFEL